MVSDSGELLAVYLTAANRHELKALPKLVKRLFGKLFGDMAYLSQPLFEQLMAQGVQLITEAQIQYEKQADAHVRQAALTQALHHRNHQRPTQEYLPD